MQNRLDIILFSQEQVFYFFSISVINIYLMFNMRPLFFTISSTRVYKFAKSNEYIQGLHMGNQYNSEII